MSIKEVRIWLNYFDQSLSRRYGRKLPKVLTVPDPKASEVLKACEALNYECEVEEKKYPRTWYEPSAVVTVRVPSTASKYEVIRQIGKKLVELRGLPAQQLGKGYGKEAR
jgi:signal recognition particle subunit SRP19